MLGFVIIFLIIQGWLDLKFSKEMTLNCNSTWYGVLGEVEFLDKRVYKLSTSVNMQFTCPPLGLHKLYEEDTSCQKKIKCILIFLQEKQITYSAIKYRRGWLSVPGVVALKALLLSPNLNSFNFLNFFSFFCTPLCEASDRFKILSWWK